MTYTEDEIAFSLGLPEGRRLDPPGGGLGDRVFGNINQFPRATEQRVEAVRKNLPEITEANLDRTTDPWTDRTTGEGYKLIRGFLDIIDPATSNATAFVISDGWIVGLRPAGFEEEAKFVFVGNMTMPRGRA